MCVGGYDLVYIPHKFEDISCLILQHSLGDHTTHLAHECLWKERHQPYLKRYDMLRKIIQYTISFTPKLVCVSQAYTYTQMRARVCVCVLCVCVCSTFFSSVCHSPHWGKFYSFYIIGHCLMIHAAP